MAGFLSSTGSFCVSHIPLYLNLIHSNELHFIDKKRIHRAVGKLVESLELAAGSTTGFNLYAVVESYFTDLNKRREINRLLNPEQNTCEETEEELETYGR